MNEGAPAGGATRGSEPELAVLGMMSLSFDVLHRVLSEGAAKATDAAVRNVRMQEASIVKGASAILNIRGEGEGEGEFLESSLQCLCCFYAVGASPR